MIDHHVKGSGHNARYDFVVIYAPFPQRKIVRQYFNTGLSRF